MEKSRCSDAPGLHFKYPRRGEHSQTGSLLEILNNNPRITPVYFFEVPLILCYTGSYAMHKHFFWKNGTAEYIGQLHGCIKDSLLRSGDTGIKVVELSSTY